MKNDTKKFNRILFPFISTCFLLSGCIVNMNPTGGNSRPDYPYFITTTPLTIKHIDVPTGTHLVYVDQKFKKGKQDQIMPEKNLTQIVLPENANMTWGGVPITSIHQFFNSAMTGYTVNADFSKLNPSAQTRFSKLWKSCDEGLGITIKDRSDWSFNKNNIVDVQSCSVLYQRYFKDNQEQQKFLDYLYSELNKINSNPK
ncbi:hypothetical protein B9T35_13145 [Acinetobacter sp. ANC 3832]|nr:hypothetical protein [Acinetobacter sp. ANC 3832]OTG92619.1 hypothetical protein B9T35_13145 [Acinetobacter sp. ANC 3832]